MLTRLWKRFVLLADDVLPMSAEERDEHDWHGETSDEEAERRQQELRMRMLEKEGKGGPR